MFLNLPNELQIKILRDYIPVKDKYNLLKIKQFSKLVIQKYSWRSPLKFSLKNLISHNTYLLDKINPGIYIGYTAVFQITINYKTASITISEFNNKYSSYKTRKIEKYIYCPIKQFHEDINEFYKIIRPVDGFDYLYETLDHNLITFDPRTCILYYKSSNEIQLYRRYEDSFYSRDGTIYLLTTANKLAILFVNQFISVNFFYYLDCAYNIGIKEFQYKYPLVAPYITIVKAYSFKKNFIRTKHLHLKLLTKKHNIKFKYISNYGSVHCQHIHLESIFHLYNN